MRIQLRRLIPGLLIVLMAAEAWAQQETRAQTRQRLLSELQNLSRTLESIVVEERVQDLVPLLSDSVTVGLEIQMPTAAIRQDLQNHREIYCRIFNASCARQIYAEREKNSGFSREGCRLSRCFLSARDILSQGRKNPAAEIRFYIPDKEEDFDFAYITYSQKQNSRKYGWQVGVMVGLERIGTNWKISALFPITY